MEERITKLEKLLDSVIKSINKRSFFQEADTNAVRNTTDEHLKKIEKQAADIDYIMIMEEL